ncbi:MAG: DegT/DnrJ/EryC1/StrS aminotransferase family protein [Myxococcales bacterium]|nr:DegT/DnrJ/EryC1/StrS aminotransferase family protein [Myxococcales bacterium]
MRPYIVFGSPIIGDEEVDAVVNTLRTCWIGTGPRVKEFETKFAECVGATHAVAVNSCTAALHLSMVASEVGPGDEVITTPMTFVATANAVEHTGATPVFVDCDLETMNIDPARIGDAVTPRTKVVLPVHFAGRPADLAAIDEVAKKHDLLVIEDAAHAIETVYHGRKMGQGPGMSCFSFYVTKNMTTGEGGMICVNDAELASKLKMLALHGMSVDAWKRFSDSGYRHYEVVQAGFKYNLTDIAASLGIVQLPHLESWLRRRVEIWDEYDRAFSDLPVKTPIAPEPGTVHARHLYTLMILDEAPVTRDEFMVRMHERGIGTGVHYRALHRHPYYRDRFGFTPESFPNANWIGEHTVSIPLSPKLTGGEVDRIIETVRSILT